MRQYLHLLKAAYNSIHFAILLLILNEFNNTIIILKVPMTQVELCESIKIISIQNYKNQERLIAK